MTDDDDISVRMKMRILYEKKENNKMDDVNKELVLLVRIMMWVLSEM